jgi:glutaminase
VNQNDAWIQNQSINTGALELTELIQKETDLNVCSNMMGTISSIVRGENL